MNLNITANLSADDVKQIIQHHLEREGYNVDTITLKVGTREVGHQMNSYSEAYFDGVDVKLKPKKPTVSASDYYNK